MEQFDKAYQKFCERIAKYVGGTMLAFIAVWVTAHVVSRYVFKMPLPGVVTFCGVLTIPMGFFSLANGWYKGGTFITINIIPAKFRGKLRWWHQFVVFLVTIVIWGGALFVGSVQRTLLAIRDSDLVGPLGEFTTPAWIWLVTLILGIALFMVRGIMDLITIVKTGKTLPRIGGD